MLNGLKKKQQGFTIIEVLVVLAIAGLIMMIVFLAVPALQRNSRNTQRTADAARVAASISECLSNKSGISTRCDENPDGELPIDMAKLSQLTQVYYWNEDGATNPGLNTKTVAYVLFGWKCNVTGDALDGTPASPRQAIVLFQLEGSGAAGINRCLDV